MYNLSWKGEIIDIAETLEEALFLQKQYELAYGGIVSILKST